MDGSELKLEKFALDLMVPPKPEVSSIGLFLVGRGLLSNI